MTGLRSAWAAIVFEVREVLPGLLIIAIWAAGAMGGGYLLGWLSDSESGFYVGAFFGAVLTPVVGIWVAGLIEEWRS